MAEALGARAAWALRRAIAGVSQARETEASGTARFVRTDPDGLSWVILPGSEAETPVNGTMLAAAKAGQLVRYTLRDGRLSVTGNASSPAVGKEIVGSAIEPIDEKAENALAEARRAHEAADAAEADAARAATAADSAETSAASAATSAGNAETAATNAQQSAVQAVADAGTAAQSAAQARSDAAAAAGSARSAATQASNAATSASQAATSAATASSQASAATTAANEAKEQAASANKSATEALTQLSFVEDVAGTLGWIQDHGTFVASSDTSVSEGKVYFELVSGDYVPIASPDPNADPHAEGWYELDTVTAQSDYIMSHLAVTSAGLWVLPSGIGGASTPSEASGWKMLLANDRAVIYDETGAAVTTLSDDITFDANRPQRIGNDTAYVEFSPAGGGTINIVGSNVYTKTQTDGLIGGISVGGTNRLLNTMNPTVAKPVKGAGCSAPAYQGGTIEYSDGVGTFTVSDGSTEKYIRFVPHSPVADNLALMDLPSSGDLVFSGYVKSSLPSGAKLCARAQCGTTGWVNCVLTNLIGPSRNDDRAVIAEGTVSEWTPFKVKINVPNTSTRFFLSFQAYTSSWGADITSGTTFQWKKLKLESGSKGTDWSPAPEDIVTALDDEIVNRESAIEQTESEIKTTVKATYASSVRNLLAGCAHPKAGGLKPAWDSTAKDTWYRYHSETTLSRTSYGLRADHSGAANGGIVIPLVSEGIIADGETLTLSFDYRGNHTATGMVYLLVTSGANYSQSVSWNDLVGDGEWHHFEKTFTSIVNADRVPYAMLISYYKAAGKWFEVKDGTMMLERGDLSTRMSSAESSITQNADNIELKVSKDGVIGAINLSSEEATISADKVNIAGAALFTSGRLSEESLDATYDANGAAAQVQTNLDNMSVGGRNLMPNSRVMNYGTTNYANGVWRSAGSNNGMTKSRVELTDGPFGSCGALQITGVQTTTNDTSCFGMDGFRPKNSKYIVGETYVFSMYARATEGTGVVGWFPYSSTYVDGNDTQMFAAHRCAEVTTTWKRVWCAYTMSAESANLYIGGASLPINADPATIQMCCVKVEKGNRPTDWTPAPEDVDLSIDNARTWYAECTTAAATNPKVATITPSTNGFTLRSGVVVDVKFTNTNSVAVGTVTLNVNGTGAKNIKTQRNNSLANLGHAGVLYANTIIRFVYNGTYWLADENYNNTYNIAQVSYSQNVKASSDTYVGTHIVIGDVDGYRNLAAGKTFDLAYPILYYATANTTTITAGNTANNHFLESNNINYSVNGTIESGAQYKNIYLKGTISGNTFTVAATNYLTTVEPTTADGFVYIPLGVMSSATNGRFSSTSDLYAYLDGKFRQVTPTEIVATHRIYYRATEAQNSLTAPTTWVEEATGNVYGQWTTKVPPLAASTASGQTKYPFLYTCEQRKRLDGTIECTKVLLDENTTVIDGGSIITNSVTANQIAAHTITTDELDAESINASNMLTVGAIDFSDSSTAAAISNDSLSGDIANAAKRTDVAIAVTAIDYTAGTASLQATLYIDGTATTSNVTYQWLKDGTAISGQTSRTLSVTSAMGLSHIYSCTVTY